jgi:hypothetical protein
VKQILVTLVMLAGLTETAAAQSSRNYQVVTACSAFGKGCVSGPTRPARFGAEVRLPGGTWIGCARSCGETLRNETVDFWAKRDAERGGGGFRRR